LLPGINIFDECQLVLCPFSLATGSSSLSHADLYGTVASVVISDDTVHMLSVEGRSKGEFKSILQAYANRVLKTLKGQFFIYEILHWRFMNSSYNFQIILFHVI